MSVMIECEKTKTDTPLRGMPVTNTRQKTPDRHQDLPRGTVNVARTRVVSWLRAAGLTFPTAPAVSGATSQRYCPLQWRGRHRRNPGPLAPLPLPHFCEARCPDAHAPRP